MATYTITVSAAVTPDYTIDSDIVNNCYSEKVVTVKHNGTDKYVTIYNTDNYGSPGIIGETITADKTYNLVVLGDNSNNQTINSSVVMNIRTSRVAGTLLGTIWVDRQHNSTIC